MHPFQTEAPSFATRRTPVSARNPQQSGAAYYRWMEAGGLKLKPRSRHYLSRCVACLLKPTTVWLYLRGDKEKDAVGREEKGGKRPRSRVKPSQEIPPQQRGRLRSGRRKSDGGWSLATASASVRCVCATHATFSGAQSCQLTKRGNSLCCFPLRYLQRAPSCSAYNGEVLKHRNHANYFPGCNKAREKDSKAALKM